MTMDYEQREGDEDRRRVRESLVAAEETIEAARVALAYAPDHLGFGGDCRRLREAAALIREVIEDE